jgi:hypothetical protein
MKRSFLSLSLLLFLGPIVAVTRADALPSLPASPADLLQVLPQAPDRWTVTQSQAKTVLAGWLQTRAVRVFQPPPAADGTPAAGSVEIAVLDTGGFRQSLGDFTDFKPGKNGSIARLLIAGFPALQIPDSEGNFRTQVLLASRYIAEVKIAGLPAEKIESWLRALHFDTLPRQTSAGAGALPSVVTLLSIDELHPERNRTYSVSISTPPREAPGK